MDACLIAQDRYKKHLGCFRVLYDKEVQKLESYIDDKKEQVGIPALFCGFIVVGEKDGLKVTLFQKLKYSIGQECVSSNAECRLQYKRSLVNQTS